MFPNLLTESDQTLRKRNFYTVMRICHFAATVGLEQRLAGSESEVVNSQKFATDPLLKTLVYGAKECLWLLN